MNIDSLEQSIALQHFLASLPDPVEESQKFNDWLEKNLESFWSIIGSEDVDIYYVRYVDGWTAWSSLIHISLDNKNNCNVRQATVRKAIDRKTGEVYFSTPENWTSSYLAYGPDHFFWRVYDIIDNVHRRSSEYKLVNEGRFKTQLGSLLEMIIK